MLENGPHLSPWDVLSLGTFCPLGRFVPGTFFLGTFCMSWNRRGRGVSGEGLHSAETRKFSINYHIYIHKVLLCICHCDRKHHAKKMFFLSQRKVRIPMTWSSHKSFILKEQRHEFLGDLQYIGFLMSRWWFWWIVSHLGRPGCYAIGCINFF